jgi:prolyl oligopeptidase
MFLAHRADLRPDGERSVLLYGYGGFGVDMKPSFSISRLTWMEMGGVFALACTRGGGEYGEAWHEAGQKANKQNVFDDFIAAAEWLVDHDYTTPAKLGIQGGSNGGLLVAACMIQRPDLFGCVLPGVGVLDMVRYTEFTAGRFWTSDYGDPAIPEEFAALYAYSPYHQLKPGAEYPPTLITTADTDDRVVPGHSFKFAAALQVAQGGEAPVLIRIETRSGHGSGKPTEKILHEVADTWAFLAEHTGLTWTPAIQLDARQ